MRRRQLLMNEWEFIKEGKKIKVDLPHTWNNFDGQDGKNDYYRGTCIYEKKVNAPDFDEGFEEVFLEFDGVNASAKVYVNEIEAGQHDGGYSTFRLNVTKLLKKGENLIRVEVDNGKNKRVYPQLADFTFFGGIYRDVNFLIVDKSHFELEKWGTPGIYVTPSVEDSGKARIAVKAITNLQKEETDCKIEYVLLDASGTQIDTSTVKTPPTPEFVEAEFVIDSPHLWNAKKDPYLYTAVCKLYRGDTIIDEVKTDFGIRSFYIDKDKGMILNNASYPMRGVSKHQDRKDIGNAISKEMMKEDMELIKEVGANCIRLAHYQHSQYFYDLADKEGMLVWAEIPYISSYMHEGDENTYTQMMELVMQNYNHPSIVTWGISNEITINAVASKGKNVENHVRLNELIHDIDPSRPTSMACFAACTPFHPVTKIPDIIGWNNYFGWYIPWFKLNDAFMWFYHTFFKKPLGYSEYGAEGMPNLHSEKPRRGDNTEEYQIKYHEYMLKCFDRHPYLWSTFVWNMFDFAADARNQGGEPGMNHKGLVTYDRKLKKDSFYLYKAWWSDEKFVHITSKRFTYRNKNKINIKVYSNLNKVSLYIDGSLHSTLEGNKIFEFENIPISEETLIEAKSEGYGDKTVFRYTTKSHPEYKLSKKKDDSTANWMDK